MIEPERRNFWLAYTLMAPFRSKEQEQLVAIILMPRLLMGTLRFLTLPPREVALPAADLLT
jgi:hypothetical protein